MITTNQFLERVDQNGPLGCWLWTGPVNQRGYGQLGSLKVHRIAYELFVGPIPDGLQIDHLCRVRHCVNPSHLEAVTQVENIRRGISFAAINRRKTHCDNGHEFTPENTIIRPSGWRACRACQAEANSRSFAKHRAEIVARRKAKRHAQVADYDQHQSDSEPRGVTRPIRPPADPV